MERINNYPGLQSGEGWYELAYATGEADWATARVRITPVAAEQEDRVHTPNAVPMPPRVQVRMSASLIDVEGQVERISGRLLLGQESIHSWQFHADVAFDPTSWLDGCAEVMISDLIRQSRGIKAASEAGLLV